MSASRTKVALKPMTASGRFARISPMLPLRRDLLWLRATTWIDSLTLFESHNARDRQIDARLSIIDLRTL